MKRLTGKDELGYYAPRDITLNCLKQRGELTDRLAYYENLEMEGRLVVLPCNVGDTVWFIRPLSFKKEIEETTVEKVVVRGTGLYIKLACNAMYETSCKSIGKTVFLTREEAEKALEGMK